jgi:importin subunit beta-1
VLIHTAARDVYGLVGELVPTLIARLENTFLIQGLSGEEKENQNKAQAFLCGSFQVIVQKLDSTVVAPHADKLMTLFLGVLNSKNAAGHEEALLAVSALINMIGPHFEKYIAAFKPHLLVGLRALQERTILLLATDLVGDVARALEIKVAPHCDELMQQLLNNLQSPAVDRSVKSRILGAFADVALAIGGHFERYLKWVMHFVLHAAQTTFPPTEMRIPENVEYLSELHETVLSAITGILMGMGADNKAALLSPYLQPILVFVAAVASNTMKSDDVLKAALGVVRDIAAQFGMTVAQPLASPPIKQLLQQGAASTTPATRDAAARASTEIAKLLPPPLHHPNKP